MTKDSFWGLIESVRVQDDSAATVEALHRRLEALSTADVYAFDRELTARMYESYRWDLWAVAYLINGGCSDDGFDYFRGWLVSQGRERFERAMTDPRTVADYALPDDCENEDMLGVAARVHEARTGEYPRHADLNHPGEPAGEPWEEEELESLYPELWERYTG